MPAHCIIHRQSLVISLSAYHQPLIMKAIKLFTCLMGLTVFVACKKENPPPSIPFPNSDFESWTYNALQIWTTNDCLYCYGPINTYVVQKDSSTVYHGKYAVKFIYNGISAAVAENKFPLSTHPSSLVGYVKTSIYGVDTVSVKIRLYKNTLVVDSGQWQGVSSTSRYIRISLPITNSAMQIDSAKVTITGGHHKTEAAAQSTILWVDNLFLQ
jgi:hypothetical protein